MIDTLMHYLDTISIYYTIRRLPSLLLQTPFYRYCENTRVHFMVLGGINRTAWGTKLLQRQSWPPLWIVSVCVTHQKQSTAL